MPSRGRKTKKKPIEKWSMHPLLHDDVSELLREDDLFFDFYKKDDDGSCINNYDTNIMGRFTCHNPACRARGWSSKKIAITIREYPNQKYNARVYHQSCKSCGTLSKPELDDSYAERVAYRIKKWSGVQVETCYFSGQSKGPHMRDLCEGCKQGHCKEGLGLY